MKHTRFRTRSVLVVLVSILFVLTNIGFQQSLSSLPIEHKGSRVDTFSACLIVMDENHRLDEWIAYHWYMLPLRHLVVAVDPRSKFSPSKIFDKWRPYLNITEWSDKDFYPRATSTVRSQSPQKLLDLHNNRQSAFYVACTRHLMQEERGWTAYMDTDEFLTVNSDIAIPEDLEFLKSPGAAIKIMDKYKRNSFDLSSPEARSLSQKERAWYKHFASPSPCVSLARAVYSAVESPPEERSKYVPEGFAVDPLRFNTLRFRYRAQQRTEKQYAYKVFIDVSKVRKKDFGRVYVHKPLKTCRSIMNYRDAPLGFHHYLGSWESFSFRDDPRRTLNRGYDYWKSQSVLAEGGADDEASSWLSGFVKEVGLDAANALLADAGLFPDGSAPLDVSTQNVSGSHVS